MWAEFVTIATAQLYITSQFAHTVQVHSNALAYLDNNVVTWLNKNTDVMQQDADFITADFLYMFRASCAHHQEYKILTRQPPVQVVMVAGGSSLRHMAK